MNKGPTEASLLDYILLLVSAASWSVETFLSKRQSQRTNLLRLAGMELVVGGLVLLILSVGWRGVSLLSKSHKVRRSHGMGILDRDRNSPGVRCICLAFEEGYASTGGNLHIYESGHCHYSEMGRARRAT